MTEVQRALQEEREKNRQAIEARRKWQEDHRTWFSLMPNKRENDDCYQFQQCFLPSFVEKQGVAFYHKTALILPDKHGFRIINFLNRKRV